MVMYAKALKEMQAAFPVNFLIAVTVSLLDNYKFIQRLTPAQIKEKIARRGGDVSLGSTYIIDLQNDMTWRFRDHAVLLSGSRFGGFFDARTSRAVSRSIGLDEILKYKWLGIYETARDGGIEHETTAIAALRPLAYPVAIKALKEKNINILRQWDSLFDRPIIPAPKTPYPFRG